MYDFKEQRGYECTIMKEKCIWKYDSKENVVMKVRSWRTNWNEIEMLQKKGSHESTELKKKKWTWRYDSEEKRGH